MLDLPPLINQLTPPPGGVFFKCILGCYLLLLCHEVLGVLVTYLRVLPAVSASPQSVVNAFPSPSVPQSKGIPTERIHQAERSREADISGIGNVQNFLLPLPLRPHPFSGGTSHTR